MISGLSRLSHSPKKQDQALCSQPSLDLSSLVGNCDSTSTAMALTEGGGNWQQQDSSLAADGGSGGDGAAAPATVSITTTTKAGGPQSPLAAGITAGDGLTTPTTAAVAKDEQQHLQQQALHAPSSHTCMTPGGAAQHSAMGATHGSSPQTEHKPPTSLTRNNSLVAATAAAAAAVAAAEAQQQLLQTNNTAANPATPVAAAGATETAVAPAAATPTADSAAAVAAATGDVAAAAAATPVGQNTTSTPPGCGPGVSDQAVAAARPQDVSNSALHLLVTGGLDAGSRQGSTNAAAASAAVASAATTGTTTTTTATEAEATEEAEEENTGEEEQEGRPQQHEGEGQEEGDGDAHANTQAEASAAAAAAAAAVAAAVAYGGHGTHICLVDGCSEDLSDLKPYFRRSKICPSHQAAPTVLLGGVVCRFCQQCTRCHPLDEFDGTKRSCRSQLAHHNKSRKHRRRCTPGSFYSTKRAKPHAAQAARAKARLLAAQQAAAAAAAAGGDTAAQQAAAAAAVASAAAAAMAEAKSKKAAAKAPSKRTNSAVTAAAAAAQRTVMTELHSSSQGTGGGSGGAAASLVTRRAAAAAAAAMEHDLAAAAEAAASAAAQQHYYDMMTAGGQGMSYGALMGDVWGRLDSDAISGAAGGGVNSSAAPFNRYAASLMASAPQGLAGLGGGVSAGYGGMAAAGVGGAPGSSVSHMQHHQIQGLGAMGGGGLNPAAGAMGSRAVQQGNSMGGVSVGAGPYATAGGSGGSGGAICGLLGQHTRATPSAGSGRVTQQGEDDAGSSSCCSSRGSPMLSGARRQQQQQQQQQQRNLLASAASAPSGSLAQYMHPAGMVGAVPLTSMGSMPPLPPALYAQQQQQLAATGAGAAVPPGLPQNLGRSSSTSAAYAAARAAAVAAAAAARNNNNNAAAAAGRQPVAWRGGMLPSDQAQALMQAGGSSFDSCADIWSGQPGPLDGTQGLAPGAVNPAGPAGANGAAQAGVYLMHKIGRRTLEQNPGSSARQAAAMADYQALQQQQQQELEQLQLWHRIQASRQVVTSLGRSPAEFGQLLTPADLAGMQSGLPASQGLYQPSAGEVSSGIIHAGMLAASGAGMHGGGGGGVANSAAGAGAGVNIMSAAGGVNGTTLQGMQAGYYQQTQSAAVESLQQQEREQAVANAQAALQRMQQQQQGQAIADAQAARDKASTAELVAMVNPAELLGDTRGPFDMCWPAMHAEGGSAGAGGVSSGQLPLPTHSAAGSTAAAAAAAAAVHAPGSHFAAHGSEGLKGPTVMGHRPGAGVSKGMAGVVTATTPQGGCAGLDAADVCDLWDILDEVDTDGHRETCDALFEHLTDLF